MNTPHASAPALAAHTPGDWYIARTGDHQALVISEHTGANVAICYDKKDAPLVAAAPELLAACLALVAHAEDCRESWESDGSPRNTKEHGLAVCLNNRAGELIRAAIAKAKGTP